MINRLDLSDNHQNNQKKWIQWIAAPVHFVTGDKSITVPITQRLDRATEVLTDPR